MFLRITGFLSLLNFRLFLKPSFVAMIICCPWLTTCGFQDEIANRPSSQVSNNQDGVKIDSSYQYRINDGYDRVFAPKINDPQIKQDVKQEAINDPFSLSTNDNQTQEQQKPLADVKANDLQTTNDEVLQSKAKQEELKQEEKLIQQEPSQQSTNEALVQNVAKTQVLTTTETVKIALLQEPKQVQALTTDVAKKNLYTVQQGDTMFGISKKTGKSIASIKELNNLPQDSNNVYIGQVLILQIDKSEPNNTRPASKANLAEHSSGVPDFHVVQTKETAYSISKRYNIPLASLASLNNLNEQYVLQKDQKLLLKPLSQNATQSPTVQNVPQAVVQPKMDQKPKQEDKPVNQVTSQSSYAYPSTAKIVSSFGEGKKGLYNDGLLFDVQLDSDVFASKDGTVFFASFVKNYQNLIILKHDDGLLSVYGNLDKIIVKKGDFVSKGQQIGIVSPRTTKTLFFSIRNTNKALNPINYIK